jgi:hypothetical protein
MAPYNRSRSDSERRSSLVAALQAQPGHRFRASELKQLTGVSKSTIRGLLTAVDGVNISPGRPLEFWYSSGAA